MDRDTIELIERLLVRAACLMEDVSVELLIKADDTIDARIAAAHRAATQIKSLADAATALFERSGT